MTLLRRWWQALMAWQIRLRRLTAARNLICRLATGARPMTHSMALRAMAHTPRRRPRERDDGRW